MSDIRQINLDSISKNMLTNGEIIYTDRSESHRKTVRIIRHNKSLYKLTMYRGEVTTIEHWNGFYWWLWKGERV